MTIALIFDVETTGLLPTKRKPEIPHIIQFSFILYDIEQREVKQEYNSYVELPSEIELSSFITELTGITREKIDRLGKPVADVIADFYRAYEESDFIIAHNIHFDMSMVILHSSPEMKTMFDLEVLAKKNKKLYCTMQDSIEICKIEKKNKKGGTFLKYPKLSELYYHLFGEIPENLHDSLVDVGVCLKCFLKIKGL
jgi:DNA polymerase III epsilon subunit-like protein